MSATQSRRLGSFVRADGKRLRLNALFEDDYILGIDKPAGLLSIQDRYDVSLPHVRSILNGEDTWIVHRLDRDMSGVMILARTAEAHANLSSQFESGAVLKVYTALVSGQPAQDDFAVDQPLKVASGPGHRTIVDAGGKASVTRFTVINRFRGYALVEARPLTGRTHQIRVHLAYAGLPVVCDALYGDGKPLLLSSFKSRYRGDEDERPLLNRHGLHASVLTFRHPASGDKVSISSDLAKDVRAAANQLSKWASI